MRILYKISLLVILAVLLTTAVLTWIGYDTARHQYIAGIDQQLTAAAAALPNVVGEDYLARASSDEGQLKSDEYDRMVTTLNDVADRSGVYYLYAFAERGEDIVHLATSASAAERAAGDWAGHRAVYEQPPASMKATFADGRTRFDQYTDEFGQFRSIFVRHTLADGKRYVIGVDVSLRHIEDDLALLVRRYVVAGAMAALLAVVAGVLIARRIARPMIGLAHEVGAWADRDFVRDEAIRARLEALALHHRDEAGDLARRFIDVQDKLETYISRLTEATAARQKLEHEFMIAKTIQEGLLPTSMPRTRNFEVRGWSRPANQTGGDYFDWIELSNGNLMLTIGDVTGHGVGPALLAAASRAYARATMHAEQNLNEMIARLNDLLHADLKDGRFVTLVACLLDPDARRMKLLAAGHGPLIFYSRRRDTIETISTTHGLPLGVLDHGEYERALEVHFEPGDVAVIVSDGFTEWQDTDLKIFGNRRVCDSVLASCREAPDQIIERLQRDVAVFSHGSTQADDTTALVIRCIS